MSDSEKLKILVIEDSKSMRLHLDDVLSKNGYNVVCAEEGLEGLTLAKQLNPDLIISDILMPGIDGYELLKRIRRDKELSSVPVIFITTKSDKAAVRKGMNLGAEDYITKPFTDKQLLNAVDARIKRHESIGKKYEEKAYQKSEEKLRLLIENSYDVVIVMEEDTQINFINPSVERHLGFSSEDIIYKKFSSIIHTQDRNGFLAALQHLIKSKAEELNIGFRLKHKSGHWIYAEANVKNLFDVDLINGLVMHVRDVSERKKYEHQLLDQKETAEELSKLKSNLLNNMNHELRTPMNGILGFAQLLEEKLTEKDFKQMAQRIQAAGVRLMNTLNSILDLSVLETKIKDAVIETVNLKDAVIPTLKSYGELAEQKKLSFEIEVIKDVEVKADRQFLAQSLSNIVDNAIKFTGSGGVRIELDFEENTGNGVITISDTGIGIPEEKLDIIFESFRQVSEGTNRKFEGTGLGLTVAKKMTEAMGGEIKVESSIGKGATFIITLPGAEAEDVPAEPPEKKFEELASEKEGKPKLDVLLVEDNEINADLVSLYLDEYFNIKTVQDGKTAVDTANRHKFDIILMDINLGPGMNGIEATREIRNMEQFETVPIVAMTGYVLPGVKEQLMEQGFSHYLPKPFNEAEIKKLLRDILNR